MYRTCLFCHMDLGENEEVPGCLVGRRLAFDPAKGRLWVVCTHCGRWNLTPLEERLEAIETCERLYRDSWQRYSVENIGLAKTRSRLELVRIGPALFPEIAAWRYGARLTRWSRDTNTQRGVLAQSARYLARQVAGVIARASAIVGLSDATVLSVATFRRAGSVLARSEDEHNRRIVIRYEHLARAELIRPARGEPWRIRVAHDEGVSLLAQQPGILAASKMLAALNFAAASALEVRWALSKLGDTSDPAGFWPRIGGLAMRTEWGRHPEAIPEQAPKIEAQTEGERLALELATRSFWGHGGLGSQSETPLYRLPAEDRLALEMAANEDVERRALAGELGELKEAWKEAEEIAAIADDLFVSDAFEEFKRQYYLRNAAG